MPSTLERLTAVETLLKSQGSTLDEVKLQVSELHAHFLTSKAVVGERARRRSARQKLAVTFASVIGGLAALAGAIKTLAH